MYYKAFLISLGCPKNLVDSEIMLQCMKDSNIEITNVVNEATVIIVNTCGFIENAVSEAIETIVELAEYKKVNCKTLIVTGCLSERYKEDIIKEIPEVDAVLGTKNYDKIADIILNSNGHSNSILCGLNDDITYLEKKRLLSDTYPYKYLKISEGCSNCCTYCMIPNLRGKFQSRSIENIIKEAEFLVASGAKELVLIAQDTTNYGIDNYGKRMLPKLIQEISKIETLKRIRLLYCYIDGITDELISELQNNTKLCNYLDIPFQHISDNMLEAMGRRGRKKEIQAKIKKLKTSVPDMVIRTTFIVGFPGETISDFRELKNFIIETEFDNLGVFSYSREDGTKAAKIKFQIDETIKNARRNELMTIQRDIHTKKAENRIEKFTDVLIESISNDGIFYVGRSFAEAPEIDGLIYVASEYPLNIGDEVMVKLLNVQDYDLIGEVVNESTK